MASVENKLCTYFDLIILIFTVLMFLLILPIVNSVTLTA